MADTEILARYDREMRANPPMPGPQWRLERDDHVVRLVGPGDALSDNCVLLCRAEAAAVDGTIAAQIARYGGLGRGFEWKVYSHDRPADLGARLERSGFAVDSRETLLALDIAATPMPKAAPGIDLRSLHADARLDSVIAVQDAVWGEDHAAFVADLAREMATDPQGLSIYLASIGPLPVATGWARFHAGTAFASLWGTATLPDYRRRGVFTALVGHAAAAAGARGFRYLAVDANATSRPIFEKLGFKPLAGITGYVRNCPQ